MVGQEIKDLHHSAKKGGARAAFFYELFQGHPIHCPTAINRIRIATWLPGGRVRREARADYAIS
jgi:hypothetical protein